MNTFMIFDERGNALDSFRSFDRAVEVIKNIWDDEPETRETVTLIEFDKEGLAKDAMKYKDLA